MRKLLFALVGLVLVAAVTNAAQQARHMAILTETDDGSKVTLQRGETQVIQLPGNSGTGYEWYDAGTEGSAAKVTSIKFQRGNDAVGAAGVYVITVKAIAAGDAVIHLEFKRVWENKPPAKTFTLNIEVK